MFINIFEFSTLYTNIPHNKTKNVMREIINVGFKDTLKGYF